MREILFRAKRIDNGEWVQGSLFAEGTRFEIVRGTCNTVGIEGVEVIPETVGQYIGLTDKNGNKIFEGDIIELYRENYDWSENELYIEEEINIVKFDRGSFYLDISYSSDGYNEISCLYDEVTKNGEVIGNIYDNPELINN